MPWRWIIDQHWMTMNPFPYVERDFRDQDLADYLGLMYAEKKEEPINAPEPEEDPEVQY